MAHDRNWVAANISMLRILYLMFDWCSETLSFIINRYCNNTQCYDDNDTVWCIARVHGYGNKRRSYRKHSKQKCLVLNTHSSIHAPIMRHDHHMIIMIQMRYDCITVNRDNGSSLVHNDVVVCVYLSSHNYVQPTHRMTHLSHHSCIIITLLHLLIHLWASLATHVHSFVHAWQQLSICMPSKRCIVYYIIITPQVCFCTAHMVTWSSVCTHTCMITASAADHEFRSSRAIQD